MSRSVATTVASVDSLDTFVEQFRSASDLNVVADPLLRQLIQFATEESVATRLLDKLGQGLKRLFSAQNDPAKKLVTKAVLLLSAHRSLREKLLGLLSLLTLLGWARGRSTNVKNRVVQTLNNLSSLGAALETMAQLSSIDLLLSLLPHLAQGIQRHALQALGKIAAVNPEVYCCQQARVQETAAALQNIRPFLSLTDGYCANAIRIIYKLSHWPLGRQILLVAKFISPVVKLFIAANLSMQYKVAIVLDNLTTHKEGREQLQAVDGRGVLLRYLAGNSQSEENFVTEQKVRKLVLKLKYIDDSESVVAAMPWELGVDFLRVSLNQHSSGTELLRFAPYKLKLGGGRPGCWSRAPSGEKFLTKYGAIRRRLNVRRTLESNRAYGALLEKMALDTYALLGDGLFYTAYSVLGRQMLANPYSLQGKNYSTEIMRDIGNIQTDDGDSVDALHLGSRKIKGYRDLCDLQACRLTLQGKESKAFVDWFKDDRVIPGYVCINKGLKRYCVPIVGAMAILAVGRILADTDVWGCAFKNVGYVAEEDKGRVVAVRLVKLDAGEAFNYGSPFDRSLLPNDQPNLNLQYANADEGRDIRWDGLTREQQVEFLGVMKLGLDLLLTGSLIKLLILRNGMFDAVLASVGLTRFIKQGTVGASLEGLWRDYLEDQQALYGPLDYDPGVLQSLRRVGIFDPRKVNAANFSVSDVMKLTA